MVALLVYSSQGGSGKTAVGSGLAKQLTDDGKKIGYFKPIITDGNISPSDSQDDAAEVLL